MRINSVRTSFAVALLLTTIACVHRRTTVDEHANHEMTRAGSASGSAAQGTQLPAGANEAVARLAASPRHGEWVMLAVPSGAGAISSADSVRAWVVYPERRTKAPVVLVIHEIFGLSPWIRGVADQLAADGFIAIAPDLMTMKKIPGSPLDPNPDSARVAIRTLDTAYVHRQLDVVARYGMALPAALPKYGVVGFCWGGSASFAHAVHSPTLGASVVYYGGSPATPLLSAVRAPVLGLYGESDARVNSTIPPADSAMKAMGKTFEHAIFPGAGHGFLRAQDGLNGANLAATKEAWPKTLAWFRKHLGA